MSQSTSLRLGTRGSKLSLIQAGLVADALRRKAGIACEIVTVKTSGDFILDRSLAEAGGKGLFVKELEEALLKDAIDAAVHSMKDVPAFLPEGLVMGAVLPREDPSDALLAKSASLLADLPRGARIGTSSVRRRAQALRARPDLACVALRGNIDTRLAKLDAGEMDAIILAMAGLKRLSLSGRATSVLPTEDWLPSLGQGALGVEIHRTDKRSAALLAMIDDEAASIELACERAFLAALGGSCRAPIAGLARVENNLLTLRGEVIAPDGSDFAKTELRIPLGADPRMDAARAGGEAGAKLRPRALAWL